MNASEELECLTQSLALAAEQAGDITPAVFDNFFTRSEQGRALMSHSDEHMRGRMMTSVYELLMTDDHFGPGGYLEWELDNHIDAYAATPDMYDDFFAALADVVEQAVVASGGRQQWASYAPAWQARIERIMHQVHAH